MNDSDAAFNHHKHERFHPLASFYEDWPWKYSRLVFRQNIPHAKLYMYLSFISSYDISNLNFF